LETLLLEGLASNRLPLNDAFLRGLEAKTTQIVEKYQDRKHA